METHLPGLACMWEQDLWFACKQENMAEELCYHSMIRLPYAIRAWLASRHPGLFLPGLEEGTSKWPWWTSPRCREPWATSIGWEHLPARNRRLSSATRNKSILPTTKGVWGLLQSASNDPTALANTLTLAWWDTAAQEPRPDSWPPEALSWWTCVVVNCCVCWFVTYR